MTGLIIDNLLLNYRSPQNNARGEGLGLVGFAPLTPPPLSAAAAAAANSGDRALFLLKNHKSGTAHHKRLSTSTEN